VPTGLFMSYRSKAGRTSSNKRPTKSTSEKKPKEKKARKVVKRVKEEKPQATPQEVTERTLSGINKLGNQIFALSPFSQYFDDWLVNLRQVVSEFETNSAIKADEQFQKERLQIFLDVEAALAQNRIEEANLSEEAKALVENNHKISDADREYAEKTRTLSNKRNVDVQNLSNRTRQLEDDLAAQQNVKFGFFQFGEKKRGAERLAQLNKELTSAKNELEIAIQNFTAEQDKLHDFYEKRKQKLHAESDRLHRELEKLETDTSAGARQTACNALVEAITAFNARASPAS